MDSINSFGNQIIPNHNIINKNDKLIDASSSEKDQKFISSKLGENDTFISLINNKTNSIPFLEFGDSFLELDENNNQKPIEHLNLKNLLMTNSLVSELVSTNTISSNKKNNISNNSIKDGNVIIPSLTTTVNGVKIHIGAEALQQIMRCETYVPPPGININDGAGVTIGYGHTQQGISGMKIHNRQDAVNVLAQDIKIAIQDKFRAIPKDVLLSLNQDQLNALASASMNLSSKGFRNFAPVKALNQKDKNIDERIENSGKAFMSGLRKGFSGLVWRRATEAMIFSGTYVKNPAKDSVRLAKQNGLIT